MAKTAIAPASGPLIKKTKFQAFMINARQNWQLYAMLLLPMLHVLIFDYMPVYGIQLAFKDYSPRKGVWGSEWVGLENMLEFFEYYRWPNLIWNTFALNLLSLFIGFPSPIILALALHMYTGKFLKKFTQNISYLPHFISLVVMVGIINTVLNPVSGFLGYFYRVFGVEGYTDIRGDKGWFRWIYELSDIWQGVGWGSIIYLSALSAVPDELHEAAKIDGATRLRRVFAIDLPTLAPLIALRLVMRTGHMLSLGHQKAYLMQNSMNSDTSEIISTYIYKRGIAGGNMDFGTAIGLLQSLINMIMVFFTNWVCNVLTDNEMGLF